MPIVEEDIDGLSGMLFPFYDADTHMLYLAGKVSAGSQQGDYCYCDCVLYTVYNCQIDQIYTFSYCGMVFYYKVNALNSTIMSLNKRMSVH